MIRHHITEAGRATLRLTAQDALWLQEQRVAACFPSREEGSFDVRAENVAGLVSNGRFSLEISPKLPVGELMWLLVYAGTGYRLSEPEVMAAPTNLTEALAQLLAQFVEEAIGHGLPRGYWTEDSTGPTLRGRLRLADQLARHHGRLHPLEITHDEFGFDIAENRIMKAACLHVLRSASTQLGARAGEGSSRTAARLRRLIRIFEGVAPLKPGAALPAWVRSSRNQNAWKAIGLCELVLQQSAFDTRHGTGASSNIIVEMWRVFEVAVARALRESRPDWTFLTQQSYRLSSQGFTITLRPDLVVTSQGGVVAVADTKYKRGHVGNADFYQLFTYASHLGLPAAHLIYAEGMESGESAPVGATGTVVKTHGLSLDAPSRTLIPQVERLAIALHALPNGLEPHSE